MPSIATLDEAIFESDAPVEMDWDSSDMQVIMEGPSSVADVVVDEDLNERIDVGRQDVSSENEEAEVPYESVYESESEAEIDHENEYYDDYRQFTNVILPFSASLNNAVTVENEDTLPGIQEIRQAIHSNSEDMEPIHDAGSSPYRNMASFLLHALFFGDEDLSSERSVKKIMYAMELLLELKEENPHLTSPAPDAILNYQNRVKNRIPVFKTTEHQVVSRSTGEMQTFFMNKPSEYLKHIIANPLKASMVTALPDDTPDEIVSLQQGSKWKEHLMFQHPMITSGNGFDIWIGDVVSYYQFSSFLLVNQFLTKRSEDVYVKYARGYKVICDLDHNNENRLALPTTFGVSVDLIDIPVEHLGHPVDKSDSDFQGEGFSVKLTDEENVGVVSDSLEPYHYKLWFNQTLYEQFKRRKMDNSLMKVVNVPLILFSDDTSGNKSKQYNKYDSFLMVPAAMTFEERNARDNHHFVCTANKVLSAVDMLPPLVDDLCLLEEGIEMYSAVYNEYVLVISPVLLISGDNPRHSQLAMHKGTNSSFYCRKCLIPTPKNPNRGKKTNLSSLNVVFHAGHHKRTLNLLKQFNDSETGSQDYEDAARLSCSKNGSEQLLRLKSFDATQDTPTEMLHCIPLGITRYLVTVLVKSNLLNQQQKDTLQSFLKNHTDSKSYSRTFRNELRYCGSFVGRDFKQLLQIIPIGLRVCFRCNDSDMEPLIQSFIKLARFASLVYVRQVTSNKDRYLELVEQFCSELVHSLLVLDNHLIHLQIANPPNISLKPKLHLLTHLPEDIRRFGCALHYETEKGELFNKFIREHLFQTNRQNTSRDVAVRFGKQFMFRFIYNGGTFLVCVKKRGEAHIYRSQAGYLISKFKDDHPDMGKYFLEGRENADYTFGHVVSSSLSNGTSGLFRGPRGNFFFGKIRVEVVRSSSTVVKRWFIQPYIPCPNYPNAPQDNLIPWVLNADGNIIILKDIITGEIRWSEVFELVEILDMDTPYPGVRGGRLVNLMKFGTLWSMLYHFNKCDSIQSMEIYFSGHKNLPVFV